MSLDEIQLQERYQSLLDKEIQLSASDFWWWAPHYAITKDEENARYGYFPTKNWQGAQRTTTYLYDTYRDIDSHTVTCVLKGRRLLMTWMITLRFWHKAMFAGTGAPGSMDAYTAALMSTDEDSAKYFLARLYEMYDKLPDWQKQLNPINVSNAMQVKFECGGEIRAFSLKEKGAVGYGFTEILFDEAAFQTFARTTYEGTRPTIGANGHIIIVSTPNGKRNWFYDVWKNSGNDYSEVHRIYLADWNIHPDRDEIWRKSTEATMGKEAFARQYCGSFSSMVGGQAVFKNEYDPEIHEITDPNACAYIRGRPVLIGWDLGFYRPAVLFGQMNHKDQFIAQHEILGNQVDIFDFAREARLKRSVWYPPEAEFIHFIPHDAFIPYRNRTKYGHSNDQQTLFAIPREFAGGKIDAGIFYPESAYRGAVEIGIRLGAVRKWLRIREADGRTGLLVSRTGCPELIEGFRSGYQYIESTKVRDMEKYEPDKESDYADIHDALQMIATGYQAMQGFTGKTKKSTPIIERMTGRRYHIGT